MGFCGAQGCVLEGGRGGAVIGLWRLDRTSSELGGVASASGLWLGMYGLRLQVLLP